MKVCTFTVDEQLLGIEIDHVVEVLRDQVVTPVPLAPDGVVGLLNLRGQIVTAVDARTRFGLRAGGGATVSMVIRTDDETVGLLVDREGEVVDLDESMATTVPATVGAALRSYTQGAYRADGELVLVLKGDTCTLC